MSEPLRLMSHNDQWIQEFEQSRSMLLQATEGWLRDVRHIGGTSFGEGVSRPVIDMLAGIADMQALNTVTSLVEGLNYARVESPEWCSDELAAFLQKPRSGETTHTVLIVRHEGAAWSRAIRIHQHLDSNLLDRQQLLTVKLDHFTSGCGAAQRYAEAKSSFFQSLDQQLSKGEL